MVGETDQASHTEIRTLPVRPRAVFERAKPTQEFQPLGPEHGNIDEGIGPSDHAQQAEEQDFFKRIGDLVLLTRVRHLLEITEKDNRFLEPATRARSAVHARPPSRESRTRIDSTF
jgi:hypothetical protein